MSATWSAEQQRCLGALGYTLYRPVAAATAPHDAANARDDRLVRSLLRAAGVQAAVVADAASWLRDCGVPPIDQLRRDPAAKRALWPRLRALRGVR
jgi:hypothetical protein